MAIYKCHNWAFDPKNQELIYADGQVKQLPGRISLCLNTLIESRGETVLYEQLLMRVWGTTHKDPSTISSVISELRKLIGCGRDKVKLLHTVPKRGYRFIGEVEVVDSATLEFADRAGAAMPATSISQQLLGSAPCAEHDDKVIEETSSDAAIENPPSTQARQSLKSQLKSLLAKSSNSMAMVLFGVLFAVSASILSANLLLQQDTSYKGVVAAYTDFERLTHEAGNELEFDISKDGRWLIYTRQSHGEKNRIVARDLQSGKLFEMPFEAQNSYDSPSFSPDLSSVVYVKNNDKACEIWLIPFDQGQFDATANRRVSRCGLSGFWTTTDFSSDGQSVYFGRSESLYDPFRIYRHDLKTGYERNLTAPTSSGRGDYAFSVSADGKQLAIIRNKLWQSSRILVKNLEDDSIRFVDEVPYLLRGVQWLSDHQLVYRSDDWRLYLYDLIEHKKNVIADLKQPVSFPVTHEGRLFAYRGFRNNASLWSLTYERQDQAKLSEVIVSPYLDSMPAMASSEQLFFISNRSGKKQLWHKLGDRYVKYSDINFPQHVKSLHYSPRHHALFGVAEERVFRFDVQSEGLTWLTDKAQRVRNVSLSDDGRLIYAVEQGENWQLQLFEIDSGKVRDLDTGGFTAHLYRGVVYFTRYREKGLWRMDITALAPELLIADFEALSSTYWDVSDARIYQFQFDDHLFRSYDLNDGTIAAADVSIDGWIKNLQCHEALGGCLFDFYQSGETEIIELK